MKGAWCPAPGRVGRAPAAPSARWLARDYVSCSGRGLTPLSELTPPFRRGASPAAAFPGDPSVRPPAWIGGAGGERTPWSDPAGKVCEESLSARPVQLVSTETLRRCRANGSFYF